MKTFRLFGPFLLLILSAVVINAQTSDDETNEDCGIICPMFYSKTCSSDGREFGNACLLKQAACLEKVDIYSLPQNKDGSCPPAQTDSTVDTAVTPNEKDGGKGKGKGKDKEKGKENKPSKGPNDGKGKDKNKNNKMPASDIGLCGTTCNQTYQPVCGSDSKWYINKCLLNQENSCRQQSGSSSFVQIVDGSLCAAVVSCVTSSCPTSYTCATSSSTCSGTQCEVVYCAASEDNSGIPMVWQPLIIFLSVFLVLFVLLAIVQKRYRMQLESANSNFSDIDYTRMPTEDIPPAYEPMNYTVDDKVIEMLPLNSETSPNVSPPSVVVMVAEPSNEASQTNNSEVRSSSTSQSPQF